MRQSVYQCKKKRHKSTVYVFEVNINIWTLLRIKCNIVWNFPEISHAAHEWVTSIKCSTHLFSTALDKRPTEHGCHPITAGDEEGFMGLNGTIIQFKHHIWDMKKEIFIAAKLIVLICPYDFRKVEDNEPWTESWNPVTKCFFTVWDVESGKFWTNISKAGLYT